jgi:hypothetical protein
MGKAMLYVIAITVFGSYCSFKVIQNMSHGTLISMVSYKHLFTAYEENDRAYSGEDKLVNYFVEGYTNKDLQLLRKKVWWSTLIIFLASLYPSWRFFKNERRTPNNDRE